MTAINLSLTPNPGITLSDLFADLAVRFKDFSLADLTVANTATAAAGTSAAAGPLSASPAPATSWWTQERALALFKPMTSFSQSVVRYVCEHGPDVPVGDVITHFGLANGYSLGGKMSSLGAALKKVPGATNPIPFDDNAATYSVKPEDAQALLAALDSLP